MKICAGKYQTHAIKKSDQAVCSYTVTQDIDILMPKWLADRINYKSVRILRRNNDGHAEVKGVRVGDEVAEIGDTILFNGRRLSVERR